MRLDNRAHRLLATTAPRAVILIRLLTGLVFLSEGIQKFLFPDQLGVGRFVKIGIIYPTVMAPFVGAVEIVGGTLILLGLLTRLAAIPLLISMFVAITATKLNVLAESGFWKFAHESRTDYSMIMSLIFLLIVGGGQLSLDSTIVKKGRRDADT